MTIDSSLKYRLKAHAKFLGFHAVGVASAAPFPRATGNRADPRRVLPGARSVMAVAMSYLFRPVCVDCDEFTPGGSDPKGKVARFAWGIDYHKAMRCRLEMLADWLKSETDCDNVICVDTGPLIDRAAAQQAGIGWYGKNNAIFIPRYGSWIVLGEIVTTAQLEPDEPCDVDRCGDCELCIKACPTGAIVKPYVIDASRCVSHLTQMKGYAPRELRGLIDDRVYGCDVCQEVCPQNHSVAPTDAEEFMRSCPPGPKPTLIPLLTMSEKDFESHTAGSAVAWIGRGRLRRNAAVAMGNSGDQSMRASLVEALADRDPIARGHAAWAIGQLGLDSASRMALESALAKEPDFNARSEMLYVLESQSR